MATVHCVLSFPPGQACGSPLQKDCVCGSLRLSPELLPASDCRVPVRPVDGVAFGARRRSPVYRFSSLRSHGEWPETHNRKGFSAKRGKALAGCGNVNTGLSVRFYVHFNPSQGRVGRSRSVKSRARLGGDGDVEVFGDANNEDYYSVLGLVRFRI